MVGGINIQSRDIFLLCNHHFSCISGITYSKHIVMKIISLTMPVALLVLTVIACNRSSKSSADLTRPDYKSVGSADSAVTTADLEKEQNAPAANQSADQVGASDKQAANPDWEKKIIKTADISLEVKRYKLFDAGLLAAVRRFGGYIAQEEQSQSASRIENTITIRVPVEQFDEAVSQLTAVSDSDKLIRKKINSEDVIGEVVDTKSRMESKREVLHRYMELLKQARNMNEILKVQNEINDIQEQIESASGRIAYLSHAATFSTINLNYYQVLDMDALPNPDPSFFYKLRMAFTEGGAWFGSLLLGLVGIWPLLLAGLLVFMGPRKWRISSRTKPTVS